MVALTFRYLCMFLLMYYVTDRLQLVTKNYRMTASSKFQMLSALGFLVVIIDNVGSDRRGITSFIALCSWH